MAMATFTPTQQQQNVTTFFKSIFEQKERSLTSVFLNAVAGAGKTSTVMLEVEVLAEIENMLGRTLKACSLSFNTNIRDASQIKLDAMRSSVMAKTTNQLGRAILANAAKAGLCHAPGQLENGKYRTIIEDLLSDYNRSIFPKKRDFNKAVTATKELLDAVRSTRGDGSMENLLELIAHYTGLQDHVDIMSGAWPLIAETINKAIAVGIKHYQRSGIHDFNDQICLPLSLDVASPDWDVIFVDEAQDLNRARLDMIMRSIKPNGVLFFVGDPNQAIQGFTYADTNSVGTIKTVTKAVEYPLSVCWRCDAHIIEVAQALVPHIEARPGAPAGVIDVVSTNYIEKLQSGTREKDPDLVLSRVKAPLVVDCLAAIRSGKSAIVRGRDIGTSILNYLDDVTDKASFIDFSALPDMNRQFISEKVSRLNPIKDESKIAELFDQADTLDALLDGYILSLQGKYPDLEAFQKFIKARFSDTTDADENGVKPIVFSTIHKAKGLEYDRVFIIETNKLPHPAAKEGWQREQEYNIIYVAVTRAKHELYFVKSVPDCLAHVVEPIINPDLDEKEAIAIAESIVAPVVETTIEEVAVPVEPQATVKSVETLALPTVTNKGGKDKDGDYKSSDWVKVAYKFSPEVVAKLDALKKAHPDLNKSAFIDSLLAQWFEEHGL